MYFLEIFVFLGPLWFEQLPPIDAIQHRAQHQPVCDHQRYTEQDFLGSLELYLEYLHHRVTRSCTLQVSQKYLIQFP